MFHAESDLSVAESDDHVMEGGVTIKESRDVKRPVSFLSVILFTKCLKCINVGYVCAEIFFILLVTSLYIHTCW